ncbi:6-phosphogluconolactonase [Leptospira bandrabouensis]|nr:6-phosphogluconolactonase [Leptospira bandrabouensis]MCG6152958.1 6-phosphogluconolactonase [Leptospira bandrabouensis]
MNLEMNESIEFKEFSSLDWERQILLEISRILNPPFSANQESDAKFHILLSGGNTPLPIYRNFQRLNLNWSNFHIWLADERCVDLQDSERSETMIKKSLGDPILCQAKFHSPGTGNPTQMASEYNRQLVANEKFDLAILGIGEDGHTASLFPENDLGQNSSSADVLPIYNSPKFPKERISLSLNKINQSNHVLFLVSGNGKKEIIQKIKAGYVCPATKVQGRYSTKVFYCIY